MSRHDHEKPKGFWRSRSGLVLIVFLAIGGYFLWVEHKAHVLAYLPLILILGLCVGMHLFMHGGHDHGRGPRGDGR